MSNDASQLDYAPAPPPLRSARVRRWIILAASASLIVLLIWLTPRAARRVQVAHWFRQCLNHVAPPDQVVFDSESTQPPSIPPAYAKLCPSQSVGTVFLHERFTPGGQRRLVAVDLFKVRSNAQDHLTLKAAVLDPAVTWRAPGMTLTRGDAGIPLPDDASVRVYAGQPDPGDPSHFTIDYVVDGARHTFDGWLKDDGLVLIEARDLDRAR